MSTRTSDLRDILDEAHQEKTTQVRSFSEALKTNNTWCVMEADHGGQITMTLPMSLVTCSELIIRKLVSYLATVTWGFGVDKSILEPLSYPSTMDDSLDSDENYYFIKSRSGEKVPGGCGGGEIRDGVWLHQDVLDAGITNTLILDALSGNENALFPRAITGVNKGL